MKTTKFIKVSTADRLPEENIPVILIDRFNNSFEGHISGSKKWIIYTDGEFDKVEFWLEEKPDYEEEMREMLEKIVSHFEDTAEEYGLESNEKRSAIERAKKLIKEAKELK